MTHDERDELIAEYAAGYDEVIRSLDNFPADSLSAHPLPDKWSANEIIHHLADSEMTSALRLRKLLTEAHPIIYGYDEAFYAKRLNYNERDIAPALEAFRAARSTTVQLLKTMSEEDWQRVGWHTESGLYSAEKWLQLYAAHAHNHAAQIRRLREEL
ncbi:MAG: DinB family protein [Acidobacteria bacterium]|nr:DinB family protein [Acidobacteriota bacterium]